MLLHTARQISASTLRDGVYWEAKQQIKEARKKERNNKRRARLYIKGKKRKRDKD